MGPAGRQGRRGDAVVLQLAAHRFRAFQADRACRYTADCTDQALVHRTTAFQQAGTSEQKGVYLSSGSNCAGVCSSLWNSEDRGLACDPFQLACAIWSIMKCVSEVGRDNRWVHLAHQVMGHATHVQGVAPMSRVQGMTLVSTGYGCSGCGRAWHLCPEGLQAASQQLGAAASVGNQAPCLC